jgi:hypothetical protein
MYIFIFFIDVKIIVRIFDALYNNNNMSILFIGACVKGA